MIAGLLDGVEPAPATRGGKFARCPTQPCSAPRGHDQASTRPHDHKGAFGASFPFQGSSHDGANPTYPERRTHLSAVQTRRGQESPCLREELLRGWVVPDDAKR